MVVNGKHHWSGATTQGDAPRLQSTIMAHICISTGPWGFFTYILFHFMGGPLGDCFKRQYILLSEIFPETHAVDIKMSPSYLHKKKYSVFIEREEQTRFLWGKKSLHNLLWKRKTRFPYKYNMVALKTFIRVAGK